MKDFSLVSAGKALAQAATYSSIIDVRSPSEYALDRFSGSVNLPVLDDLQRVQIGTLNKQVSAFEAKRVGASLVAGNIANILANELADLKRDAKVLVYCWRGGNRSASLATVLSRIGYATEVIEGGYRAYRREIIVQLETLATKFDYRIIVGRTGSGKSLILEAMKRLGMQVLDLEGIARHKGSVLGLAPGDVQPSQKGFESLIWSALQQLDPSQPVYVESESKKIGQCQVPEKLIERMRESSCIDIQADMDSRVILLRREYPHFQTMESNLLQRLEALTPLHGHAKVQAWHESATGGRWNELITNLLESHYDPAYDQSIRRNFRQYQEARQVRWSLQGQDHSDHGLNQAMEACAQKIMHAQFDTR